MLVLFEDEHLLVVNKPSGINTHKPDRYAPDGIHEWLSKRRAPLSVLHRLDKDTSGVLVFGKTRQANQSLARQFESHTIRKEYLLLSKVKPSRVKFRARSVDAATEFEFVQPHGQFFLVAARPVTGKTHQIRRHAADNGFPILGDTNYGGEAAPRLMLHAHRLTFEHPKTREPVTFEASVPRVFEEPDAVLVAEDRRELLFDEDTTAYRLLTESEVVVDWYDGHALVQWQTEKVLPELYDKLRGRSVYEQTVTRQRRTIPRWVRGETIGKRHAIRENGVTYLVNFGEGLSTGIFLDQRENRWRLLTKKVSGKTLLNCFSYTCAFSVAAGKAGVATTSIDLSKNYLAWGKENFRANELDPDAHSFLHGDVFDWLRRFEKRQQRWDIVILDPPTFSTTKTGRAFRAARDYQELEELALRVVAPGGTLLCSTNQRTFAADEFEATLRAAAKQCGRVIASLEFETVPFDFRVAEGERPYLKTLWAYLE